MSNKQKIQLLIVLISCSFLPLVSGAAENGFQKVLFLGNSITLHGPNKGIGWEGNWGMAASSLDKDYVHLVTAGLTANGAGPKTMIKNIAAFEREYSSFDLVPVFKETEAFKADLIIVAVGENVPGLKSETEQSAFKDAIVKLIKGVKTPECKKVIVRSSFWANAAKDTALRQACEETGGTWVDISTLGKDEKNYARSERSFQHDGVAAHPGDCGMKAIADAMLTMLKK